jgi:hypothetical protein
MIIIRATAQHGIAQSDGSLQLPSHVGENVGRSKVDVQEEHASASTPSQCHAHAHAMPLPTASFLLYLGLSLCNDTRAHTIYAHHQSGLHGDGDKPLMWEIIRSGTQRPCECAIHRSNGSAGIHPMSVESSPPIATISSCPGGLQLGCAFAAPRTKLISCFYLFIYSFIHCAPARQTLAVEAESVATAIGRGRSDRRSFPFRLSSALYRHAQHIGKLTT